MAGHYERYETSFTFVKTAKEPNWREAQRGALASLLAHWSIHDQQPAVVALPTGAGKTAVATAVPYLVGARRTLVVAPSRQLRVQLARAFREESVLRQIGALVNPTAVRPEVVEVTSRAIDWRGLQDADVVVALPASISPVHQDPALMPADLFDLVVVDEAHHVPASTWQAIVDHWSGAKRLFLTATPQRRDGKRIPGDITFHYPLRRAIAEGVYKAVTPEILPIDGKPSLEELDEAIVRRAVQLMSADEHRTSVLLVRSATRSRANNLAKAYLRAGLPMVVLTARTPEAERIAIMDGLANGVTRAVAVVGMLGEGYDLPNLRIVAYHDKHKSTIPTVQLIGRLVRSDPRYPQPSVLVTAADSDVYPVLRGVVRELWAEDADWSHLLPKLVDDEVERAILDRKFVQALDPAPAELSLDAISPGVSIILREAVDPVWVPDFVDGELPPALVPGARFRGREVFYASLISDPSTVMVITRQVQRPRWHRSSGLDAMTYELHLLTWIAGKRVDEPGLLLVNDTDRTVGKALMECLGIAKSDLRPADPRKMHDAFDSVERLSVSSVGVRNTYSGGRGAPTYKTFLGSGVDRGIREADVAQSAVGHAMAQVESDGSRFTTGVATEKSKFWQSRYLFVRNYLEEVQDFAARYRTPTSGADQLLPNVARGERLLEFPSQEIVAMEANHQLTADEWVVADDAQLGLLDLRVDDSLSPTGKELGIVVIEPVGETTVWRGYQDITGEFYPVGDGNNLSVRRGLGSPHDLGELLSEYPPTVYYRDGTIVQGSTRYSRPDVRRDLPDIRHLAVDWSDVNLRAETNKTADEKKSGLSVQSAVVRHIDRIDSDRNRRRWVLLNDGKGEIADFIEIEVYRNRTAKVALWHVKAAGGSAPSVRVGDMQVVVAQAIKSRRWLHDRGLWSELGRRLDGESSPAATVVAGDDVRLLRTLLGRNRNHPRWALDRWVRTVRGEIVIAQPGLSWSQLESRLRDGDQSAQQVRDLLAVFDDSVGQLGMTRIACAT